MKRCPTGLDPHTQHPSEHRPSLVGTDRVGLGLIGLVGLVVGTWTSGRSAGGRSAGRM
ncbi:MAG: hypothetical protein RQ862_11830 [Candidatus Caldarchaeales archaeon]|nr:hypothetical protein [Candidatus Caldarchaeales archaeon]